MRVDANDGALPVGKTAAEAFDSVRVDVRGQALDSRGQVDDDLFLRRRAEGLHDRRADLDGIVDGRRGKALGRVFERKLRLRHLGGELGDELGGGGGHVLYALEVSLEDDPAVDGGDVVIQMHRRALGAADGLERLLDEVAARGREDLYRDVVGNVPTLDERAHKVVLSRGGGGEADLDLLEAYLAEHLKERELILEPHGGDERLISVAQVDAAPYWRRGERLIRPRAVSERDGRRRYVFLFGVLYHQ